MNKIKGTIVKVYGSSNGKKPWASILVMPSKGQNLRAVGNIKSPEVGS